MYIKKIPRVKDARDWLLTWSPDGDAQDLPSDLKKIINESWGVTRGVLVAEKEEKWHVHFIFSTARSYNSDYAWWKKSISHLNYGAEFDLKFHNNFLCCAGGYLSKDGERLVLASQGISKDQLAYGQVLYEQRLLRQKVRKFVDDLIVINPDKIDAAVGAVRSTENCSADEAIIHLGRIGFAFARSRPGFDELYRRVYGAQELMSEVPGQRVTGGIL